MQSLHKDLNFYANYAPAHVLHDIWEHRSWQQVGLSIVKIISYATLIVPIIFAIGYQYTLSKLRPIAELYERVTQAISADFVDSDVTQKELIQFLKFKIQDENYDDDFKKTFLELTSNSQSHLFKSISKKGKLLDVISHLPKELTELNLHLGRSLISEDNANDVTRFEQLVTDIIKELKKFNNLTTLHFNLSKIAYYSEAMKGRLRAIITKVNLQSDVVVNENVEDHVVIKGKTMKNNFNAASKALYELVAYLYCANKYSTTLIHFYNDDIEIANEGGTLSEKQ